MQSSYLPKALLQTAFTVLICVYAVFPQQTEQKQVDDVLRFNTELVQTGVAVLDKSGHFVDGLKREDFELRVAGRVVPIDFFENIVAGSQKDRLARRRSKNDRTSTDIGDTVSYQQRTVIFFIDDRHLSLDSVGRTRKMLLDFINKRMGQNDLVAIASASGQIGFLQQFTDNREVLREAVARVNHVPYSVGDYGKNPGTPMTEYLALTIERKDDSDVLEFFIQDCQKWAPKGATRTERFSMRRHCEIEVQNRARQILLQAGTVTSATYYSLETLLHSAERMPGSKLAFFVSDGFLADTGPRAPVATNQLERITDEARRAGVVIYTIDARGLISGAIDATGNTPLDPNGRLENANAREIIASQEALESLAGDTGGRALRNQNSFDQFIDEAFFETSRYYLIAWRPEPNEPKNEVSKKIQVSIVGHPELTVRSARGFVSNPISAPTGENRSTKEEKGPEAEIKAALNDFYPSQALPLKLSLIYLDTPDNGIVLTSSLQAPAELLAYGDRDNESAQLTIAGVVLDDKGKPAASFKTGLKVSPPKSSETRPPTSNVIYNNPTPLKPGIYQVRAAARDDRSGILGSAMEWIAIPDLSTHQLALSSLIVGIEDIHNSSGGAGRLQWSVDRIFPRNSRLRFMTFIYNAAPAAAHDLVARVQVYKDGRTVVGTPFTKVVREAQGDHDRIPFNAEINMTGLSSGRYILEVTVEDRSTQKTAAQQASFHIQ